MKQILGIGSRINHPEYGIGVVTNVSSKYYWVTFVEKGLETIEVDADFEVIEAIEQEVDTVSFSEIESSLVRILKKWSDVSEIVPMAERYRGGKMILQPADRTLQSKEIPVDTFFHKIVMLRDRLRVMEQKINAHKTLTEDEKIELQQYVTRSYGSLTTFNILFKNSSQQFVGDSSKKRSRNTDLNKSIGVIRDKIYDTKRLNVLKFSDQQYFKQAKRINIDDIGFQNFLFAKFIHQENYQNTWSD